MRRLPIPIKNYASPESKHVLRCNTYDYRGVFR